MAARRVGVVFLVRMRDYLPSVFFLNIAVGVCSNASMETERQMVSTGEAAAFLGVTPQTMRRWDREGRLVPDGRTPGGRRRYDLVRLSDFLAQYLHQPFQSLVYLCCPESVSEDWVASRKRRLRDFCRQQGWDIHGVTEIRGIEKSGLSRLLSEIVQSEARRVIFLEDDGFLSLGRDAILAVCASKEMDLVVVPVLEGPGNDVQAEIPVAL